MPIRNKIIVRNSANTVNSNAKPQVLDNGWIVVTTLGADKNIYLDVSKDGGGSFQQLCFVGVGRASAVSVCSFGSKIYLVFMQDDTAPAVFFLKIDVTTVNNVDLYGSKTVITLNSTSTNSYCSIAINSIGTELTIVWSDKTSIYPTSFNIRTVKSINDGTTWTKLNGTAGIEQITTTGSSGSGHSWVYVIYDANDTLVYGYVFFSSSSYAVYVRKYVDGAWSTASVYTAGNYHQGGVNLILQKYGRNKGRIYILWWGLDSSDTAYYQIRFSYSDNNGVTWTPMSKVTNTSTNTTLSLAIDMSGVLHVYFRGTQPTAYNLKYMFYKDDVWSSPSLETNDTTNIGYPSVCDNYFNFIKPLVVWQDNQNLSVKFSGIWSRASISGNDKDLGLVTSFNEFYTIDDPDETTAFVTERLDDEIIKTYTATIGQINTIDLTMQWKNLSYGRHSITIECDNNKRIINFTKCYGKNSKTSEIITELQNLTGINQETELRSVLLSKSIDVTSNDGIAEMVLKLNNFGDVKRWVAGTGIVSQNANSTLNIRNLMFKPKIILALNYWGDTLWRYFIYWSKLQELTGIKENRLVFLPNFSISDSTGGNGSIPYIPANALTLYEDGFSITSYFYNTNVHWIAIE